MRRLIALVLAARVRVIVLAAAFLLVGTLVLTRAPLEVLPDFAAPQVVVQTEARGFDPELVERLVTRPIENALNGVPGLESLRSESIAGLSAITLGFADGSDPHLVRQGVAERLADIIPVLPVGAAAPRLSPLTSATMDVLKVGLVSDRVSAMELRHYAETVLRPALLSAPGVARVNLFGGELPQVEIALQADRMIALDISQDALTQTLQSALTLRGSGFVETDAQRLSVSVPLVATAEEVAALPVAQRGARTILLGEVASVSVSPQAAFGDALIQGRSGVLLTISSQFEAHTLEVTRALEQRLADFKPQLEQRGITLYPALHRPASFLTSALTNLRDALLLGAILVSVILVAFLRSWRAALVTFVAIPLSLLAAALVLWREGLTVNTMTLGGFAVALGVLVDDAIIDVENILRRLRGRELTAGERMEVVLGASLEVRSPMVYATLVVLIVFIPVILLPGVEGRLIAPLAWAFVLSVVVSLIVALTVTPALAALLLTGAQPPEEPRWVHSMRGVQRLAIERARRAPWMVISACAIALTVLLVLASRVPTQFIPAFREGHLVVQVDMDQPGISLATMRSMGVQMSRQLLTLPFVATVEEQMGRAEMGEDIWPIDRGEFHVELKADPSLDQDWAQERVREVVAGFPGVQTEVLTFLGDRLSETLTGETSQVVIGIYGDDLDAIDSAAARIAATVEKIDGVTDVVASGEARIPQLQVKPKPAAMLAYSMDLSALATSLAASTQGIVVGAIQRGELPVPVTLRYGSTLAEASRSVEDRWVLTAHDGYVPFGSLATLSVAEARAAIRHESGRRYTVVGFNVARRSIRDVTDDARRQVAALALPASVEVSFGGVGEAAQRSGMVLGLTSGGALVAIAVLLLFAFRRRVHAALVMLNLPFTLIGAIGALLLLRLPLSLGAAVGLVTVFGISARNSVLLLSHLEHLQSESPLAPRHELALRAAEERLVPVCMTALVAGLGLLPIAFGLGRAGHEIEAPLAIVVLGGLISSTLLSLVLTPALAGGPVRGHAHG